MKEKTISYQRLCQLNNLRLKSFNEVERKLGYPRNALNSYQKGRLPPSIKFLRVI